MSSDDDVILKALEMDTPSGFRCCIRGCTFVATMRVIHTKCGSGDLRCTMHTAEWQRQLPVWSAYYLQRNVINCPECGHRVWNNQEWKAEKL